MKKIFTTRASRRVFTSAAVTVLSVGMLAACSTGTSSDTATKAEDGALTPLKIIVAPIQFEPAYLADRLGYFEEQGLDVEIITGADAQANFAQAISGDVDIVTTSWTVMVTSRSEGVPLTAVAANGYVDPESTTGNGVLVRPDSGIESIADLEGKTLAVQGVRSGSELGVMVAAEEQGIDPESITQVAIPFSGMQAALEAGQVDAVMVVEPFFSQIEAAGMDYLGNMGAEYTPGIPTTVWAATDEWVAENGETATKFAAALEDAVAHYSDPENLEEVRALTAEITQSDIEKVTKSPATIRVAFDEAAATASLEAYARLGYITNEVSFADVVWESAPLK